MRTAGASPRLGGGWPVGVAVVALGACVLASCARFKAPPKPAPPPVVSAARRSAARELYSQGVERYLNGDLKGAVKAWHLVLLKDPNHKDAKRSLARAELELEALRKRGKH